MTQVSKIPIKNEDWKRIYTLFIETLSGINNKAKFEKFVDSFLSPTEKIVFAKRLALLVLLSKGHDYASIKQILKISPPTIAKMSIQLKYSAENITPILEDVFKRQAKSSFWEEIKDLLDVPHKQIYSSERIKRSYKRKQKIKQIMDEF